MKKMLAMLLCAATVLTACGSSTANTAKTDKKDTQASEAAQTSEAAAPAEIAGVTVANRLQKIVEQGYIEVATEPYFAPYEFIDPAKKGDEQYVGCDIEIAKAIAEKLGVELKLVPLEFSAVLASVTEGKYDLCISAIAYSPTREEAMTLSKGYHFDKDDQGYGFLTREEDAGKYNTVEDVKDAVLCTQSGSVQEYLFNEYVTADGCKELKLYSAMTDAFLALSEGKADVCVCSIANAKLYAEANGGLAVSEFKFPSDPELSSTRIGAPKGDSDELMEVVNIVIDELRAEDKIDTWYDDYSEYAKSLGIN